MDKSKRDLAMKAFIASVMVLTAILLVTVVVAAIDVVWLLVLSVLFAVVLRIPMDFLMREAGLSNALAVTIVLVALTTLMGVSGWFLAPQVYTQFEALFEVFPRSPTALRQFVEQHEWGRAIFAGVPGIYDRAFVGAMQVIGDWKVWMSPLRLLGAAVFVSFISVYVAASPRMYVDGAVRMMPLNVRAQGARLLDHLGETLRWWMVGRLVSMVAVGSATTILLWILDIPLALVLGLLTTLLTFVPYLGPLVAAFPILVVTVIEAPEHLFLVLSLYTTIQLLEGYLLTPMIQRLTVYLPPAMTLIAEIVMGMIFGTLGVVVATPVAAIILVLVQGLYVEAWLERRRPSVTS